MNTLMKQAILPGILNELMTSNVNCQIDKQFTGDGWPRVDIVENESSYSLKAELPGIDRKDINVIIEKGILRIEGEKKAEPGQADSKLYHIERKCGKFSRSFALPEKTDSEHIEAKMANGVLELTITKTKKEKPKTIEVKIN